MIQIILYLTIGLLFTLLDLILIRRNRRILVCLSTFFFLYTLYQRLHHWLIVTISRKT